MKFVRLDEGGESAMNVQDGNPMPIVKAHKIMTHCGEDDTRLTFKYLGIPISRSSLPDCVDCALEKAKGKVVPKAVKFVKKKEKIKPIKKGLVSLDLSKVTFKIDGKPVVLTNPNWILIVDHKSHLTFQTFHSTKDGMVEPTCSQISTWIKTGHDITTIRCDNAGENKALEKKITGSKWQLPITFVYTARSTPQQNSLVEVKFNTIASRARAVIDGAKVPEKVKKHVYNECLNTVTLIDDLIVRDVDGKTATRFKHWGKTLPKFDSHLREWSEAGVVFTRDIKTNNLTNK